ncbi:hypothetical protein L9F63_011961, partial [Diploptera punctata]
EDSMTRRVKHFITRSNIAFILFSSKILIDLNSCINADNHLVTSLHFPNYFPSYSIDDSLVTFRYRWNDSFMLNFSFNTSKRFSCKFCNAFINFVFVYKLSTFVYAFLNQNYLIHNNILFVFTFNFKIRNINWFRYVNFICEHLLECLLHASLFTTFGIHMFRPSKIPMLHFRGHINIDFVLMCGP